MKQTIKMYAKNSTIFKLLNPLRLKFIKYAESQLSDLAYFTKRHKKIFGYEPDFKHPATFNEKIIHRILFDRNPLYTHLADKLKARIYIANTLQNIANERERERERFLRLVIV